MLTINADAHPLMNRFHKPGDEKRMLVLLEPAQYRGWLEGELVNETDVYRLFPADRLVAAADPLPPLTSLFWLHCSGRIVLTALLQAAPR